MAHTMRAAVSLGPARLTLKLKARPIGLACSHGRAKPSIITPKCPACNNYLPFCGETAISRLFTDFREFTAEALNSFCAT
jgi:hypothetical protein